MELQFDEFTLPKKHLNAGVDHDILKRASAVVPILRKNSEQADREGRLPQENIEALTNAGLWGLTRPRERGGYETNIRTVSEVIRELATGCGSTAWVVMISTIEQWAMSFLDERAQNDIYAETENPKFCGTFAPTSTTTKAPGGILVSGRWGWASNSEFADWGFMGIPIKDENDNIVSYGQALIPMNSCRIEKTWDSAGLRASSSHHVVAENVFVPDYFILDVHAAAKGKRPPCYDGALYKAPFTSTANLWNASPMAGLAQFALEATKSHISEKPLTYTIYAKGKDAPTLQIGVARATSKIDTALLNLRATADRLDASIGKDTGDSTEDRARVRMTIGQVGQESREAMDHLLDACGAGVFLRSNPIQLAWRDLSVACRHGLLINTTNAQVYGAELLKGSQIVPLL